MQTVAVPDRPERRCERCDRPVKVRYEIPGWGLVCGPCKATIERIQRAGLNHKARRWWQWRRILEAAGRNLLRAGSLRWGVVALLLALVPAPVVGQEAGRGDWRGSIVLGFGSCTLTGVNDGKPLQGMHGLRLTRWEDGWTLARPVFPVGRMDDLRLIEDRPNAVMLEWKEPDPTAIAQTVRFMYDRIKSRVVYRFTTHYVDGLTVHTTCTHDNLEVHGVP